MKNDKGFALIAALLVMVVVLILVFGTAFTSMVDRMVSANQRGATDAYYVARAGLDKYKTIAFQAFRHYLDNIDMYEDELSSGNPTCGNFLSIGLDLNRNGILGDSDDLISGRTLGPFQEGNGEYTISMSVPSIGSKYIVLTSQGSVHQGRGRATVQMVVQPRNSGALSYAIFAGTGQSSKFLNGGVAVYGSVHVVGDENNSDAYVIDANGNFNQYNYYSSAVLDDLVKDSKINGEKLRSFLKLQAHEQKDLCARLRVEHGRINLSGSAAAGSSTAPTGFKAKLEGVNVDDGIDEMSSGTLSRIHADEVGSFDLSSSPPFPKLDDSSLPLKKKYCEGSPTWRACLHNQKRELFIINPNGTTSYYDATLTTLLPGCTLPIGTDSDGKPAIIFGTDDYNCRAQVGTAPNGDPIYVGFIYDADVNRQGRGEGELTVYGINNFRGLNIEFKKDVAIRFENQATFFVEGLRAGGQLHDSSNPPDFSTMVGGNVTIAGDLLPTNSFPDKDVLGIIADSTLRMTGDTQNIPGEVPKQQIAMGLYYAGREARIEKGGLVFGSVVAPSFSFSSGQAGQTSKIVQVPGLEYNATPGLEVISGSPTFRIVSFERR